MSRVDAALRLWNKRVADMPEKRADELRGKLTWPSTPLDLSVAEQVLRHATATGRLSPVELAPLIQILVHHDEAKLHEVFVLYSVVLELTSPAAADRLAIPLVLH